MDWLSLTDVEARVNALESLMVEKGLAEHEAVDAVVASFENDMGGPVNGAKVVARAWTDPEYKEWLLRDATAAIADMGFTGLQTEHMVAVENTAERHNVVVCTLCSCYPWTCSAFRRRGSSTRSTARGWSRNPPEASWPNSASSCPTTSRSTSGTAAPRSGTW